MVRGSKTQFNLQYGYCYNVNVCVIDIWFKKIDVQDVFKEEICWYWFEYIITVHNLFVIHFPYVIDL